MKDYDRLTKPSSDYPIGGILYCRLKDIEDKIERGEIDYVADKDKEIARLTAENAELTARLATAVELPVKVGDTVPNGIGVVADNIGKT